MPSEKEEKVNRVSFSLEEEYRDLLTKTSKKMRLNRTAVIRWLLDENAPKIGLKPVATIAKKGTD